MPFPDMGSSIIIIAAAVIFILACIGAVLVLWIAMPFSLFGLKGLLKRVIEEQERTNSLLSSLLEANAVKERAAEEKNNSKNGAGIDP